MENLHSRVLPECRRKPTKGLPRQIVREPAPVVGILKCAVAACIICNTLLEARIQQRGVKHETGSFSRSSAVRDNGLRTVRAPGRQCIRAQGNAGNPIYGAACRMMFGNWRSFLRTSMSRGSTGLCMRFPQPSQASAKGYQVMRLFMLLQNFPGSFKASRISKVKVRDITVLIRNLISSTTTALRYTPLTRVSRSRPDWTRRAC